MKIDPRQRSLAMSVAKAIAIIAMVIGHAEAPAFITGFIYTWHMPLFFIAAGYFFNPANIHTPWDFISRRFSKLYIPFVKWSLLFWATHNLWFYLGILNTTYGNWNGGVTHPYSWASAMQRLVQIFTSMSGYDEFMAGAFWFFRGLLVASILFLVAYRLLMLTRRELSSTHACLIIITACIGFTALRIGYGIKLNYYPNGGFRETWGILFFAVGVIYRSVEHRIRPTWGLILGGLIAMCIAGHFNLRGMNNGAIWRDLWSLPLTGTIGFITVHALSRRIAALSLTSLSSSLSPLATALGYIGANTMPIFVFHIIAYKPVSLLKIWWYGLDPAQIGCHMVVHYNNTDSFWILYTICGIGLPLAVNHLLTRRKPIPRKITTSPA